jgi:hypothetical protein
MASPGHVTSGHSPVIRFLLVIQMPNAGNVRGVAVFLGPINRFSLRFECDEDMIRMVFDHVIVDMAALRSPLGTRLNINVRHALLLVGSFVGKMNITQSLSFR